MRIIAGKYRRRKLLTNTGLVTRPITDRVKEYLFQRLHDDDELSNRRVADVFAGTGTLGLEALSRGVASAVFFENDHKAHELLQRNLAKIRVDEPTLCWRTDVMRTSFCPKGVDHLFPFDLIFFDPPFRLIPKLVSGSVLYKSLERLASDRASASNARLILRTPERAEFECPQCWQIDDTITVSRMELHLFRKQESDDHEHS